MNQPEPLAEAGRDEIIAVHRVAGLSDAVFAIAMTLLVLELRVPEMPRNVAEGELLGALLELAPVATAFVWTFLLSSLFWYLQARQLQLIARLERPMVVVNLVTLMMVALLPFSAALQGRHPENAVAGMAYFGNMAAISLALLIHWRMALNYGALEKAEDHPDVVRLSNTMPVYPLASIVALLAALIGPVASTIAFIGTIGVFSTWQRFRSRRAA